MIDNDRVAATKKYARGRSRRRGQELQGAAPGDAHAAEGTAGRRWQRTGLHPKRGEINIEQLAEHLANHDDKHIARIRELRSS